MSVLLLRHASAGKRSEWAGDDTVRPLDKRGRKQALALRDRLSKREIGRIVSSPYRRCVETVEPLAVDLGISVELDERLAEGTPPPLALSLLAELDGGLVCTHGDVIEGLLGYSLPKGAAVVVDVDGQDVVVLATLPAP
jgi:8-oxo-dGTP diphosphatase